MNAALEALVMDRPRVWVAKPVKANRPRIRAGRSAARWNGTQANRAAAREKRSASSSGTGSTASVSLTTTKVVPQISVTPTRTATPARNGMRAIMPRGPRG
jgi:hypothetical protein